MSRARMAALSALAAAGLLGAHVIDYVLIVPDPGHRHDLLLRTGHGYLSVALAATVAAAVVALLTRTAAGLSETSRHSTLRDAVILATTQIGAFVSLEAIERLVSGVPADARLWRVIALGVALQAVIAVVTAFAMRVSERLASVMASRAETPQTGLTVFSQAPGADRWNAAVLQHRARPRAPPSASAA